MVLMITGCRHPKGEEFNQYHKAILWRALNVYTKKLGVTKIIVGCALGVDYWTAEWCRRTRMPFKIYEADWKRYRKTAGHIRNSEMLFDSDLVIAFWDDLSTGTLDAIKKAKQVGKLCQIIQIHRKRGHYTNSLNLLST